MRDDRLEFAHTHTIAEQTIKFPVKDGKALTLTIEALEDNAPWKLQMGSTLIERKKKMFRVTLSGLEHPWMQQAFPDGCAYHGKETFNPAFLPLADSLPFSLKKPIDALIKELGLTSISNQGVTKQNAYLAGGDLLVYQCDFDAPPEHPHDFKDRGPVNRAGLMKLVEKAGEAVSTQVRTTVQGKIAAHSELEPDAKPEAGALAEFVSEIQSRAVLQGDEQAAGWEL